MMSAREAKSINHLEIHCFLKFLFGLQKKFFDLFNQVEKTCKNYLCSAIFFPMCKLLFIIFQEGFKKDFMERFYSYRIYYCNNNIQDVLMLKRKNFDAQSFLLDNAMIMIKHKIQKGLCEDQNLTSKLLDEYIFINISLTLFLLYSYACAICSLRIDACKFITVISFCVLLCLIFACPF